MTITSGIQTMTAIHPNLPIIIIMFNRQNKQNYCAPPLPHQSGFSNPLFWGQGKDERFYLMVCKRPGVPQAGGGFAFSIFGCGCEP